MPDTQDDPRSMAARDRTPTARPTFHLPDSIGARNDAQRAYVESIRSHDVTLGIGPAGTGKTHLAVALATSALRVRSVSRLVITRPAVEAGEKLGFLPGDLQSKIDPYLRPIYDSLQEFVPEEKLAGYLERGVIEVAPLAFMRGRTLKDAFIILDEAQNTTAEQMKMLLTRLGEGSRVVVTGDVTQIDLPRHVTSGLSVARRILAGVPGVAIHEFSRGDVVRHPLVARIIEAYEDAEDADAAARAAHVN